MNTTPSLDQEVYLKSDAVRKRFGNCSHMWIIRRMKADGFPQPVTFGGKVRFWSLSSIMAWEAAHADSQAVTRG